MYYKWNVTAWDMYQDFNFFGCWSDLIFKPPKVMLSVWNRILCKNGHVYLKKKKQNGMGNLI